MTEPKPLFTPEQVKEDAKNKVARTYGQSGLASAAVLVGLWVSHQFGWHGEMPSEVQLALGTLLTGGAAALMNLGKLRAK